jgi:hypothetical protein
MDHLSAPVPWGRRTYYTQLRLDPLPVEKAEEHLGALLGSDADLDALKRVLIARTEGKSRACERWVEIGSLSAASAAPTGWPTSRPPCRPCWPPASNGYRLGTRLSYKWHQ